MNMWPAITISTLLAGVASLVYFLLANKKGWAGFNLSMNFLVIWLPALSLLMLVFLCLLAARAGLRWTSAAALILLIAAVQFGLFRLTEVSLWTLCFLPAVLTAMAAIALACRV